MPGEHKKRRTFNIKQRQQRKKKLHLLKAKYQAASSETEKEKIKEKMEKIAPCLDIEKYLTL